MPLHGSSKPNANVLKLLAHPKGFEPLASAFGGITTSSAAYAKEHAMTLYHAVNKKEFDLPLRRAYPDLRHGFRPAAYVVLTQEAGSAMEEARG